MLEYVMVNFSNAVAKPYNEFYLPVGDGHEIRVMESGAKDGTPMIFLHGGPGNSYAKSKHIAEFLAEKVRIIQFDQRGCGLSRSENEITENTTQNLIKDMEIIREHLGISSWLVGGRSWGSTLALLYSQAHPEVVAGIFVASIWLARRQDIELLATDQPLAKFFPDLAAERGKLNSELGVEANSDLYRKLLVMFNESEETTQKKIIRSLEVWETNLSSLENNFSLLDLDEITAEDIKGTRVMLHYLANNCFIEENQILENTSKLAEIPMRIIHGRYDMVCPLEQAYLLHKALPKSKLEITNFDGHATGVTTKQLSKFMFADLLNEIGY